MSHQTTYGGSSNAIFFAGVGVWSYALRMAGWPDNRPVWTGSCPCQPFSSAGKGVGFADERHLWPAWYHLIDQRDPPVVFGEQVASKAVEPWIDLVQADMEALVYAFGCVPFPSAGVGAPHIRDRAYWVGHANGTRSQGLAGDGRAGQEAPAGVSCGLADLHVDGLDGTWNIGAAKRHESANLGSACRLADAERLRRKMEMQHAGSSGPQESERETNVPRSGSPSGERPGPVNGFWRGADWLGCRDDKFRPVRPGSFPLANGAPSRVGRLRAYGNAINAQAAAHFIAAYMECQP